MTSPFEYTRRFLAGLRGFRYLGIGWLVPCLAYFLHPLLRKFFAGKVLTLSGFHARVGSDDFFVLGQIFREYNSKDLISGLNECDLVIDAGANVGAFSWLVRHLAPSAKIVAIEPEGRNFHALSHQPFSATVTCLQAALSVNEAGTFLIESDHSATHRTSDEPGIGVFVPTVTLESLSKGARKILLKLDIEGAEKRILENELPASISTVIMEWHYSSAPPQLAGGQWIHHGENSYTWLRNPHT